MNLHYPVREFTQRRELHKSLHFILDLSTGPRKWCEFWVQKELIEFWHVHKCIRYRHAQVSTNLVPTVAVIHGYRDATNMAEGGELQKGTAWRLLKKGVSQGQSLIGRLKREEHEDRGLG